MKQIIPFKKELLFKTKVSEITSISLEHNLSLTEDDLVSGEFVITGDYKMTDASINREKFEFTLPENVDEFTFKVEFGSKSWAKMSVNGYVYNQFKSKIYNSANDKDKPETVELTFKKSEFKSLDLRNGYSMNHRYYINGTEVPLTQDDYSERPTDFILELK